MLVFKIGYKLSIQKSNQVFTNYELFDHQRNNWIIDFEYLIISQTFFNINWTDINQNIFFGSVPAKITFFSRSARVQRSGLY